MVRGLADINTGTALHYAAINGKLPLARVLLRAGADPTLVDGNGHRPSQIARRLNFQEMVYLLEQAEKGGVEGMC